MLAEHGIEPLEFAPKEGLSLVNGTEPMQALLAFSVHDAQMLVTAADVACALSVEALLGTDRPYDERVQVLRPHPGQLDSAANLRALLAGSPLLASHRHSRHAVQDAYSLRCAPQVHGAVRDVLAHARRVIDIELDSVVDNPVIVPDGEVMTTGNFHGEPLAFAADMLAMALAELASISERRVNRMLDPAFSRGLPPFLAPGAGTNSGFMLAQYTAASLVSENKVLAHPASVDSIPTSGKQEDHVSMGWTAVRKLREVVANVRTCLAVEVCCAAQGIDLRAEVAAPSDALGAVHAAVRDGGADDERGPGGRGADSDRRGAAAGAGEGGGRPLRRSAVAVAAAWRRPVPGQAQRCRSLSSPSMSMKSLSRPRGTTSNVLIRNSDSAASGASKCACPNGDDREMLSTSRSSLGAGQTRTSPSPIGVCIPTASRSRAKSHSTGSSMPTWKDIRMA